MADHNRLTRERAEQGLPPFAEDPVLLAKTVAIVLGNDEAPGSPTRSLDQTCPSPNERAHYAPAR